MQLVFDEQTLRQLVRPIVAEIIAGIVEAERRGPAETLLQTLLTAREAARFLRVSQAQLARWEKAGLVNSTRLGKLVKYHRDELQRIAREGFPTG
jgi:hypothetical protein